MVFRLPFGGQPENYCGDGLGDCPTFDYAELLNLVSGCLFFANFAKQRQPETFMPAQNAHIAYSEDSSPKHAVDCHIR